MRTQKNILYSSLDGNRDRDFEIHTSCLRVAKIGKDVQGVSLGRDKAFELALGGDA